jgi:FlaA1/EpsC-like NDP-sugar epimerase
LFNLDDFINSHLTKRSCSMFADDISNNTEELSSAIEGKSMLVIGGAGSIGSSFIRAVMPFHLSELVVVDTNENALAELARDLHSSGTYIPPIFVPYPMDYCSDAFQKMFISHRGFDIVANFSAHKHVRSEKDIFSIEALLYNNVINAKKLLDLLSEYKPDIYFCVSTDKAANPVNIMGASKRIMEDLIFSYSDAFPVKTARFANVAFSNGSLPAGFLERIRKLQPISAPSDVKRYFVSPDESGQICMLSAMLGGNREIFFPKLKENQMMTFDAIAKELLWTCGYEIVYCESDEEAIRCSKELKKGSKRYPVHFSVSDTSGEKAFEEFYTSTESVDQNRFLSLGVIIDKPMPNRTEINLLVTALDDAFKNASITKRDIVHMITSYLPSFEHMETGKSLDAKM